LKEANITHGTRQIQKRVAVICDKTTPRKRY